MESGEIEALIECLVANPHDTDALARAHRQGEADPQGYAYLLEQVGTRTPDPSYASHWLSEAANIWSVTLGDAHRAARVLMIAVDRDPTQALAADRLAQLYRDKGDVKALVAMLDRRVKLLTPVLATQPEAGVTLRPLLATLHEELGKLWSEPPIEQPRKAIDHYKRAIEFDPASAFSIFSVRELYKSLQQWDEALSMYTMELALERDPERRLMLFRDEAATRRLAGDLVGVTHVLRTALEEMRGSGSDDPVLVQEVASSLLDRAEARAPLDDRERAYGADLLAALAEQFDGEHGLAYAAGALDLLHGHDRAMQLFEYYSSATGGAQGDALSLRYHAYVEANPSGPLASEGRLHLAAKYEALGQAAQALQVLAPLRGQPEIDERMAALQGQAEAGGAPTPVVGVEELGALARSAEAPTADTEEVVEAERPSPQGLKQSALDAARACLAKSDKAGALERFLEVLQADPVESEALSWVEDTLRAKRDYAKLRDVLWASARAMGSHDSIESKKLRLREIAGLSESNLKDVDGAIQAWRQLLALDRGDDAAHHALVRAMEKAQRWDDLANVYEQEASVATDTDARIQLEKKLATLHDQKRNDPLAAAEAWARIASLTPEDDHALVTAADLFERAGKPDLAAAVIQEQVDGVPDVKVRAALLDRMGKLLGGDGARDLAASGRAFQRAAEADPTPARWTSAERAFAEASEWALAASAAERAGEIAGKQDPDAHAEALARASKYLRDGGDVPGGTALLERAHALSPTTDSHAVALADDYRAAADHAKLTRLLVARGASHADKAVRVSALREAARLFATAPLDDANAARSSWQQLLDLEEDAEALEQLVSLATLRGENADAAGLLRRLGAIASTKEEKVAVALREADLLSRSPEGADAAVARYEWVLESLEPTSRTALRAIADLEEKRGAPEAAAKALERELPLVEDAGQRREIAARLASCYEAANDDSRVFTALEVVRAADPEDFDTLGRLATLAEKLERWDALIALLAQQIEVEADEAEAATLTRKRAAVLADELGRGDEALAALQELADAGDASLREEYVALGDRLGWRGIVATKLVEWWFPVAHSEARTSALTGAFERFALVGRDADAVRVGVEILRSSRDAALAQRIEDLAVKVPDEAGLTAAQEILGSDLSGAPRAIELVRQAEMRVRTGMAWAESVQHGETGLGGLTPEDATPLLARLAALVPTAGDVVDLYERQVSRSRGGEAREKALIRAALVAGERGELKRARTFFDLAVSGTPTDATLDSLAAAVRGESSSEGVRRALAEAMAQGGEGVRDGGRSRANLLRRAALIAERDLHDVEQAFAWLRDALVAHADTETLDALAGLAGTVNAPRRIEEVLTHVLTEVFDGPLVRLLLARRARVRKELLGDRVGAAADLKKLHDLSPTDEAVVQELSALLLEQGDHRAMIQLYEDQILRSKDQALRAEVGRKVAQTWESELGDAREAADAWRRVLRLKPGDEEATQGLDRAKSNMLRKGGGPVRPPAPTPQPVEPEAPASTPTISTSGPAPHVDTVPLEPQSTPTVTTPGVRRSQAVAPAERSPEPPAAEAVGAATSSEDDAAKGAPKLAASAPVPEPLASSEAIAELDLEPESGDEAHGPQLEHLLGSTDPFAEADSTHTSIDVRLPMAAAAALDNPPARPAPIPAAGGTRPPLAPRRSSRPPPLPPGYEAVDQPAPAARSRAEGAPLGPRHAPTTDRALAMTDQNPVLDFSDQTSTEGAAANPDATGQGLPPPADILSATELMTIDDEDDDVLVVDEFVEDVDDEFEDVVEPSKPHGPLAH